MVLDKNITISEHRWEELQDPGDEYRKQRREQVQEQLQKGRLTQDKILERVTGSIWPREQPLQEQFRQMADPQSGHVTKQRFVTHLASAAPVAAVSQCPEATVTAALGALFDMVCWYAAFPFPLAPSPGERRVDEAGFIRAARMLCLYNHRGYFETSYGTVSPYDLGPYKGGAIISNRHVGAGECWRRRTFRALAKPAPAAAAAGDGAAAGALVPHTIAVPRFYLSGEVELPEGEEPPSDADDDCWELRVVHDEDERTVDLRDVLADTWPGKGRPWPRPNREDYDDLIASKALPWQAPMLAELAVSRQSLRDLLTFLAGFLEGGEDEAGSLAVAMKAWADELKQGTTGADGGDGLGWEAYDAALEKRESEFRKSLRRTLWTLFPPGPREDGFPDVWMERKR